MRTHLLAGTIALLVMAVGPAQTQEKTSSSRPAELVPAAPRDQKLNVATRDEKPAGAAQPTSGTMQRGPGKPGASPKPMLDTLGKWREFDERLREASRRFGENTARREQLMKKLAQNKDRVQGGQMDPASILARKEIDKLAGELHTLIEADHDNNEQATRILRQAIFNRDRWAAGLAKILDQSLDDKTLSAADRDRMRRWRQGIAQLQQDNPREFVRQVLGKDYADYLVDSMPMLARMPHDGFGPGRGPDGAGGRGFWLGRIAQLERQQATMRQQLDRQDREIARIRAMLEKGSQQPPKPPMPPAKGPEQEHDSKHAKPEQSA
ncbi:hypothetical protein LLG95_15270 [bacterium]|nr:hypothetical protein [bacterium]